MIKELLASVSDRILGLPYYTTTGVRKSKPIVLPVVSCPSLRGAQRAAVATILVTIKNTNLAHLYDEIEVIINAVTVPNVLVWLTATVASGTDGHYAELIFEAPIKLPAQPATLAPTAILETVTAYYANP